MALVVRGDLRALIYPLAGILGGLFLFYKGFVWFRRKRLIEDVPTSKIRSIAMGLVEVKGTANSAKKTIKKSPLSGDKCVYYRYTVEKLVQSGKSSHWRIIRRGDSKDPFFVEDNTGKVIVDPTKAELHIAMSYHTQSKWGKDPEPVVKKFLENEKIRFQGGIFGMNYTMRFREWVIIPKKEVYVMGTAADNPYVEEGTAVKGVEDIIIKKGADNIMIISTHKEKQILNKLKWQSIGGIIGGALIAVVSLMLFILMLRAF